MSGSTARPDLRAYEESTRLPPPELVDRLREMVGAKLVAYVAGLRETRAVRDWASGATAPSADVEARLRATFRVSAILMGTEDAAVVQAWLQGANEQLGDRAPARMLRDGDLKDFEAPLVAAAREFTAC